MPLKIGNVKRKQQKFVTKIKSSESLAEICDLDKIQQNPNTTITFTEYYRGINECFGYTESVGDYLGRNVPPKIIANIALHLIVGIQRHLQQMNAQQLPFVLTPEHIKAIMMDKEGQIEIGTEFPRVEDPRQRALPPDQQTKIIWLKDLPYMSRQQLKANVFVSGEKDIVWSFGVILYEMIYGLNPFWDTKDAIQPKQQWHWIPLNDENGEMSEAIKKINEEQKTVEWLRQTFVNLLEKDLLLVSFGGLDEFDSIIEACLQNEPEKRITLNELSKRMTEILEKRGPFSNCLFFEDRRDAGQKLSQALAYLDQMRNDIVVLALPRGGVPVAYEIAKSFNAPLGLLFTKKIGFPDNEEIGIGAVADGNPSQIILRNEANNLHEYIEVKVHEKKMEIEEQKKKFLKNRPPIPLDGRIVIVVDDGIATGVTAEAALAQLRDAHAAEFILATPVCPSPTLEALQKYGVKIVCLETPPYFTNVGSYYKNFDQTTDEEVIQCLNNADEWMKQKNDGE